MSNFEKKVEAFLNAPSIKEVEEGLSDEIIAEIKDWLEYHDPDSLEYDIMTAIIHLAKNDFLKLLR